MSTTYDFAGSKSIKQTKQDTTHTSPEPATFIPYCFRSFISELKIFTKWSLPQPPIHPGIWAPITTPSFSLPSHWPRPPTSKVNKWKVERSSDHLNSKHCLSRCRLCDLLCIYWHPSQVIVTWEQWVPLPLPVVQPVVLPQTRSRVSAHIHNHSNQ